MQSLFVISHYLYVNFFFQVLLAIGRDACTRKIGLETVGVKINEK